MMINHFVIIINFRNHFDKALTEIFQFRMTLVDIANVWVAAFFTLEC